MLQVCSLELFKVKTTNKSNWGFKCLTRRLFHCGTMHFLDGCSGGGGGKGTGWNSRWGTGWYMWPRSSSHLRSKSPVESSLRQWTSATYSSFALPQAGFPDGTPWLGLPALQGRGTWTCTWTGCWTKHNQISTRPQRAGTDSHAKARGPSTTPARGCRL